jgi:tetratricopeptide (TPR) repeat protein
MTPSTAPTGENPQTGDSLAYLPPRRVRVRHLFMLGFAVLIGLSIIMEMPQEIARWHLAAALEREKQQDPEGAISAVDRAIVWDSGNPDLFLQRAKWKLDANDREGSLADCNQAVELAPDYADGYIQRGEVHRKLNRPKQCVNDWNEVVRISESDPSLPISMALNGRAYMRALGEIELKQGLEDARKAIEILEQQRKQASSAEYLTRLDFSLAVTLDTRGYLHYLLDDPKTAIEDYNQSIKITQKIEESIRDHLLISGGAVDPRMAEQLRNCAIIYHHRGLAYEKLGQLRNARIDKQRALQLGFDPQKDE